jgi:Uncharacterized protein conserved in bacteria (DUF2059)
MIGKSHVVFFVLAVAMCPSAMAIEDTPANREAQATYYLQTVPMRLFLEDTIEKLAASVPAEHRAAFKTMMTEQLDAEVLTNVAHSALLKHFTPDELKALGDFYGSPLGKSAMAKFGDYMAEVMPAIQAQIMKSIAKSRTAARKEMPDAKK